jgi:hypothetical protein
MDIGTTLFLQQNQNTMSSKNNFVIFFVVLGVLSCTSNARRIPQNMLNITDFYSRTITANTPILDTLKFLDWLDKKGYIRKDQLSLQNETINLFKEVRISGSTEKYLLVDYQYKADVSVLYPWKNQFIFSEKGGLVAEFAANSFRLLDMKQDTGLYLLLTFSTAKGNGHHSLLKVESDSFVNVLSCGQFHPPKTYDCEEFSGKYSPCELEHRIIDLNSDRYNDIRFEGNWSYLGETIPIVLDFIYNPIKRRFCQVEDYYLKYPFLKK